MPFNTIRELFAYNSWANEQVFRLALALSDEQLDRPFDMGPGTLRETLRHIYGAERNWFERIKAPGWEAFPRATGLTSTREISDAADRLAEARAAWLDGLLARDSDREFTYSFSAGDSHTSRLDDILLHVCNHGVHHRAQALNMLRQLGAPIPRYGIDYAFMFLAQPERPAPELDLPTVRHRFAYGDWAFDRVLSAAAELADDKLDRPFEMGMGTLRKTLVHIHDAERWWTHNWLHGPQETFPAADATMPLRRLGELFGETSRQRNAFVASKTDAELRQPVTALVRPGKTRVFPLGATMLQLCCHGTHHRAQAVNMLRRLGATPPEVDLIGWSFLGACE